MASYAKKLKEGLEMYISGMTYKEVADTLNISITAIRNEVKNKSTIINGDTEENIKLRNRILERKNLDSNYKKISDETFKEIDRLILKGEPFKKIARETGVSPKSVRVRAYNLGIDCSENKQEALNREIVDKIVQLYKEGNKIKDIGEILNVSTKTVTKYLKSEGEHINKKGRPTIYNDETIDKVLEMYDSGISASDISDSLNLAITGIVALLKKNGKIVSNRTPLNDETIANILKMHDNGENIYDISDKMRVSVAKVKSILKNNDREVVEKIPLTEEEVNKIIQLKKDGFAVRHIAVEMGISTIAVTEHLKGINTSSKKEKIPYKKDKINTMIFEDSNRNAVNGDIEKIKSMYKDGYSVYMIAEELGIKLEDIKGIISLDGKN